MLRVRSTTIADQGKSTLTFAGWRKNPGQYFGRINPHRPAELDKYLDGRRAFAAFKVVHVLAGDARFGRKLFLGQTWQDVFVVQRRARYRTLAIDRVRIECTIVHSLIWRSVPLGRDRHSFQDYRFTKRLPPMRMSWQSSCRRWHFWSCKSRFRL